VIACGLARLAEGALGERGEVVLWARSEASARRARGGVGESIRVVTSIDALSESSAVLEAVVEDAQVKADVLTRLGAVLRDVALLASTTSSLPIAPLAEASGRPDRFVCTHFFNPVEKMALVELAFPEQASDSTRGRARALCEALGKTPVEVPDSPGFVVNRLLFPYLFDAVRLMDRDGLAPEAVDTCMKLGASHPMGPLALLDFVGLDVAAAIGESLGLETPERLRRLVAEGKLGKKSGAGFYEY
jgi:3-hydroxybutyryl-CoA dehydrogenase